MMTRNSFFGVYLHLLYQTFLCFSGRKTTHQLAFSLLLDSVEVASLDFVAPDEQVFDYWTDGINALLGMLNSFTLC